MYTNLLQCHTSIDFLYINMLILLLVNLNAKCASGGQEPLCHQVGSAKASPERKEAGCVMKRMNRCIGEAFPASSLWQMEGYVLIAENDLIHANDYGLPLNAFAWLETHHQSKAPERMKMIREIALPRGGFVIDAGCGPGLWSPLLAGAIGPEGRILGIDISDESLRVARQRSQDAWYQHQVEYRQATLESLPIEPGLADAIFSANVSQYLEQPAKTFAEMGPYLKPGGRLIIKDIDFGTMRFGVLDDDLQKRVFRARKRWEKKRVQRGYAYEDSWVGSKLRGYLQQAGYHEIKVYKHVILRKAPLTPSYRSYLEGIVEWFICEGAPLLSIEDKLRWHQTFFSEHQSILDHPEFFCQEVEYVVSGVWQPIANAYTDEQSLGRNLAQHIFLPEEPEVLLSSLTG